MIKEPAKSTAANSDSSGRLVIATVAVGAIASMLLVGGLIWLFEARLRENAQVEANEAVAENIDKSKRHMANREWALALDLLRKATSTKDATDKAKLEQAQSLLQEVEEAQGRLQASALLASVTSALDSGNVEQGASLLRDYLGHPGASEKPKAERPLHDINVATSESSAKQMLSALTDQQLSGFAASGLEAELQQLQHPKLRDRYRVTLLHALGNVRKDRAAAQRPSESPPVAKTAAPTTPVPKSASEKPQIDPVQEAIDRGVQFLRKEQLENGSWEVDVPCTANPGGWSSLAMLALLNAGVPPEDPAIARGLTYLRTLRPARTYVVGLQTMAFVLAARVEDKERIQKNADWLVRERVFANGQFGGWTYSEEERIGPASHIADNSNTQYAILGLQGAQQARAQINPNVWKDIEAFYTRTQHNDGGWGYTAMAANGSTLTMTAASLCGMIISAREVNEGAKRETALVNGAFSKCGSYEESQKVTKAMNALVRYFRIEERRGNIFYSLYGLERAGDLTGQRFLGVHDWYREGCEYLLRRQDASGSWLGRGFEQHRTLATSFAILFLSKGRTPVLINKLVHDPGDDWNNDHSDARNLVAFASRELFKRQPLAWQVFDSRRGARENAQEEISSLVSDLAESPIAYFNGHAAPQFTEQEEDLLRKYVDQGGFILAEACCGRREFDKGFRDLMSRIFPDEDLRPLAQDHPVWRSHFVVAPGSFKLEGIEVSHKTVVIYSPVDMSCYWESNHFADGKAEQAFRLGANIIAYAMGTKVPKPRLSEMRKDR